MVRGASFDVFTACSSLYAWRRALGGIFQSPHKPPSPRSTPLAALDVTPPAHARRMQLLLSSYPISEVPPRDAQTSTSFSASHLDEYDRTIEDRSGGATTSSLNAHSRLRNRYP
ncbi:hypothetical protein C8F04DRAFT_1273324 [Mycena alexandri]|uniref:Uncharacterized protein n=1 Tax=Mycena alexandri TaxID=1745969 RepID=A0AAD6S9U8_9AGAR|nr:hypothetical protein C8F04DRAFT_1273324 [Mycena alexandri]